MGIITMKVNSQSYVNTACGMISGRLGWVWSINGCGTYYITRA